MKNERLQFNKKVKKCENYKKCSIQFSPFNDNGFEMVN